MTSHRATGRGTPLRTLLLALLAVLALFAAGCGDDGDDGDSGATTTEGESDGEESQGPSGDPIKIGVIATLSGPAAQIGQDQVAGLEAKADELNAENGILGRPVELIIKDDGGDPTKASQVMRELVDQEEVSILFGPTLSSAALAAAPIAMEAGVLMFPTSVAPELGNPEEYPYVFRVAPAATLQAQTFVDYAMANGWKKLGLLAVNNALGSTSGDAVEAEVEGTDIEVVARETHETGAVDLVPQMSNLQRSGADVVLVLNTAIPDQAAAVKARNAIEWDVPMLGFSTMANPLVTEAVGGVDAMKDVHAGQNYRYLTGTPPEATAAFLDLMRERLNQPVLERDMAQAAAGYAALTMMAAAIEEVGSLDDPDALRAALEEGSPWDTVQGTFTYEEDNHLGAGPDTLVFVIASSFEDGLYELSPNQ